MKLKIEIEISTEIAMDFNGENLEIENWPNIVFAISHFSDFSLKNDTTMH